MGLRKILGGVFGSIISRNQHRIYMSVQVAERILREMEEIHRAQSQFARAMTHYAEQLKSHTSAIEGLSKASHELTISAAEQNKVLTRLIKLLEQSPAGVEKMIPEPEEEKEAETIVFPPGCYGRRRSQNRDERVLSIR